MVGIYSATFLNSDGNQVEFDFQPASPSKSGSGQAQIGPNLLQQTQQPVEIFNPVP